MGSRHVEQAFLQKAFPGRDASIERACRESVAFRDLCHDYRKCALALERWSRLEGDEPISRTLEYSELLAELTSEVESWLETMANGSVAPRGRTEQ